ncbi:MAG TPA: hypothetical protein VKY31_14120 [Terriglobia bacterium]|nr:hypothetical protein [Terriglobia bacterium]
MKALLCAFLSAIAIPLVSFGQTIQSGYAVITPVSGTGGGLSVTEIYGEQVGSNFFQSSVTASPLVTLTSVVVNVNTTTGINTGVAIVNPNNAVAVITLTLSNQGGVTTDTRTITLGAHQQISRFVTELFSGTSSFSTPMTGLLFVSSAQPLGVLGLAFNGFSFTSLPVASQISVNNTTVAAVSVGNQPVVATFSGSFSTQTTSPLPSTITQIPSTIPALVPQQLTTSITTPLTGVAPVTAVTPLSGVTPLTGSTTTLTGTTGQVTVTTPTSTASQATAGIVFPQLFVGVGGPGAQLLAQVVSGGGWVSQIMISNTSGVTQTVRIDFFDPFGGPLPLPFGPTLPSIVIASGGVATVTTAVQ